jgi:hypothetical protein
MIHRIPILSLLMQDDQLAPLNIYLLVITVDSTI